MRVHLVSITGYAEAINALRMSKGKFYSYEKLREIQQLVDLVTDERGFLETEAMYKQKFESHMWLPQERERIQANQKVTGVYQEDVKEFARLLGLTKDNAMGTHKHQTLMEYLDITFITEGMHRGAQDDLDSHARSFNNRITRFSTRLAEIDRVELSEWYQDKVIPFGEVQGKGGYIEAYGADGDNLGYFPPMPEFVVKEGKHYFKTPFGYVLEKHAKVPAKNGFDKDVQRGLMPLGMKSDAQWMIGASALRYVYKMRSKFTKTNPELKIAMEMLADELEKHFPVFGQHFRYELTDTGKWEHLSNVRTVTSEEYQLLKKVLKEQGETK